METNVRFTNKFSTTKTALIKNIKEVFAAICADSSSCEINIQIGIFLTEPVKTRMLISQKWDTPM